MNHEPLLQGQMHVSDRKSLLRAFHAVTRYALMLSGIDYHYSNKPGLFLVLLYGSWTKYDHHKTPSCLPRRLASQTILDDAFQDQVLGGKGVKLQVGPVRTVYHLPRLSWNWLMTPASKTTDLMTRGLQEMMFSDYFASFLTAHWQPCLLGGQC
ncbi:hypothetical protein GX51_07355 [Blastomyces parvus]|uniref:Uncharacterized protein n=1 Tax=Blastomyces parvus TaxID=2060905 RepID=A0A2B7WKW1_9EURO|nr:hypothetical protein GX51_07355 [Blastomyces parvus]